MAGSQYPFRHAIGDQRLRRLADVWWRCRSAGSVPDWRQMPHATLEPLLPAVLLFRFGAGDRSFQLETLSEDTRGLTRLPINGERIENLLSFDMLPQIRGQLLSVVGGPAVAIVKVGDRDKPERGDVEERLLMPFRSGAQREPNLILAAYGRLDPRAAGWLPITQQALTVKLLPVPELERMGEASEGLPPCAISRVYPCAVKWR